jgi:hypothetical protein
MFVPEHLDDPGDLVVLAGTREKGKTKEKFNCNAAQGPHIYCRSVRQAQ